MRTKVMKIQGAAVVCFSVLLAGPLLAQTQIGGGTCSSATLTGTYSLTLSGRAVTSSLLFSRVLEGIGTATFDGESGVVFSFTGNTNQSTGVAQTFTGTYSLQANCAGTLNLTTGDVASFSLEAYNTGKDYLITGLDGTFSFTGNGSKIPTAPCSASVLNGAYSFNGTGFQLTSGAVSGATTVSGLLQFDGIGAVTATFYSSTSAASTTATASGKFTVTPDCAASGTVTDASGNNWVLQFAITSANGSNFILSAAEPAMLFSGSGRLQTVNLTCSVSTLTGVRSLVLTGRDLSSSGLLTATFQSNGSATFDGMGNVTFALTANSGQSLDAPETLSGTYTLGSNCAGSLNITSGDAASFTLIAYNTGANFTITGEDGTYALTGSGNPQPVTCAASGLSGTYAFSGNGNSLGAGFNALAGANSISGLLQFDGRGDINGSWSVATNAIAAPDMVAGQYSLTSACGGTATVMDTAGASFTLGFSLTSADGANFSVDITNATSQFSATGHSTFTYPGLSVVNAASSAANGVPPGSIFAVYGSDLATGTAQPSKVPLPTSLLTTSVTVNGEAAPLFYVGATQINAQMPLDIAPGVASVVVKNGSAMSNAVAVTVPATAVPGVFALK
jgi:hypothetical protein